MPEQTLPEFLYSVITEQRKSISSLVDALNEAKNGISHLSVSAERGEESRRQVEMLLERQSVVESDLKFDLTQCHQHNEVLQGQVRTLEESLRSTDNMLAFVTAERDALRQSQEQANNGTLDLQQRLDATIHVNAMLSDAYVRLRVILKANVLPKGVEADDAHIIAFTEQRARELVDFQDKVINSPVAAWLNAKKDMMYRSKYDEDDIPLIVAPVLAAGTLDCVVPAETPAIATEAPVDRLATICTYQPGNTNVLPGATRG